MWAVMNGSREAGSPSALRQQRVMMHPETAGETRLAAAHSSEGVRG